MKKLLIMVLIAGSLFIAGCARGRGPSLRVESITWTQSRYGDEWGIITVHIEVCNDGDLEEDYYEVHYKFQTEDGHIYSEWTNDLDLGAKECRMLTDFADPGGKKCVKLWFDHFEYSP